MILLPLMQQMYLMGKSEAPIVINADKGMTRRRSDYPKLTLYFRQNPKDVTDLDNDPIDGEISFRLMGESRRPPLERGRHYAERIKSKFVSPLFHWDKGKTMYSYCDWDKGYQLQLLCANEAEAQRIVEQTLDIQGHSPDWEFFNTVTNKQPASRYDDTPATVQVMGEAVKENRERVTGRVWFRSAFLSVPKINKTWILVDCTGRAVDVVLPIEPVGYPATAQPG